MYLVRWRMGDKRRSWLHLRDFGGGRGLWTDGSRSGKLGIGGWLGPEKLTHPVDGVTHTGVLAGSRRNGAGRVQDRRVVAPEVPGDVDERELGQLAREVHRDLPGPRDSRGSAGREHRGTRHAERGADGVLDRGDGGSLRVIVSGMSGGGCVGGFREDTADERAADGLAEDRGNGSDAGHRPLKPPHVPGGEAGDVVKDGRVRDLERHLGGHPPQEGGAGPQVGGADGDAKTPLEAITKAVGEADDGLRWAIAGQDDLLARRMQGVEGMDELLLRLLLALEHLDVVDQERVELSVPPLEELRPVPAQGGDELGREPFGGGVVDRELRATPAQIVGDRPQEMRLSEPRWAVEEERVVGLARELGHGQRGGVSHAVAGADHEALERMPWVEVEGLDR